MYGTHVAHGGFAWDDWRNAATTEYGLGSRFLGPFDVREALYEPGLALLLPLPHLAFGLQASWHLALAALLGVAMSLCVFALLRELGLETGSSLLVALLVLVFPWSDSVRLWATAGLNQVAACLYLIGVVVALRGLAAAPARAARLARISLALYAASMLTYPVAGLLIAGSTALYRLRVPWRAAWRRGRWDLVLAVVILGYVSLTTTKPVSAVGGGFSHAGTIADQWLTVLARAMEPFGHPARGWVIFGAAAVALAALAAARRRARSGKLGSSAALTRSLKLWAGGAAGALAAYAIFVPAEPKYVPLAPGLYNRVGLLAAPGAAILVVGLAGAAAELVLGARGRRRLTIAVATALGLVVLASWASRVHQDSLRWNDAAGWSRRVLATLESTAPHPGARRVLYVTGYPRYVAPGIPVFSSSFDLSSAGILIWGDSGASAYPLNGNLRCGPRAVAPRDPSLRALERSTYGHAAVIDVGTRSATSLSSRRRCRHAAS